MVTNLTNGKPVKLILSFCIPMIFGNIFQQLYSMIDSIIIGQFVGKNALAAVGATGSIMFMVIGFVLGLCSGFLIPASQKYGAGDYKEMRKYIINAIYLSVIFGVILTVVMLACNRGLLELMKTPDDIIDGSESYMRAIYLGILATVFYNIFSSILRAVGDSKTPLMFLIVSSILNIILDLFFVLALGMEEAGVGYATVIAQAISAILCYIYIKKKYEILQFEKDEVLIRFKHWGKLLISGVPMALQFSITAVGTIIIQTAVNKLGTDIVTAVTVASRIQTLLIQPLESLGITMATYCGQNVGAKKLDMVKAGMNKSLFISLGYSVVAFLGASLLGSTLALMFLKPTETQILGDLAHFLTINGIFYPFLGVLFLYRNSLQGLGYGAIAMLAGVFELIARIVIAFIFVDKFGYNAACFANPVAWIAAAIFLVIAYIVVIKRIGRKFKNNVKEPIKLQ